MKIGIAGAGIAGLTAAALLARDGHEVTVCDQFNAPSPVGSGLMVQPVGLRILQQLGLDEALIEHASPVDHIYGETYRALSVLDVRYADLRPGLQGYGTQRAHLFELLLRAAQAAGATIVPTTEVRGVFQDGAAATLETDGDPLGPFDMVLDCLGAYSPLCPKPSSPLAYGALWALLDWPEGGPFDPHRLEQRYERASKMVGVLPVGSRAGDSTPKLTFFWSLRAQDHAAWRAIPIDTWRRDVTTLWPATVAILDQITSHDDLIFAQYTHRTLSQPGAGRVAHLGDSHHATSPQLGQGANTAMLDAFALWAALHETEDPVAAIRRYGALRRWHVWLYQTASWLFTPVYQSDSRVLPWIRNRVAAPLSKTWPAPRILAKLVSGELGYRPPRLKDP
ncbi:MAG: NAD(P)/FAD-dependent oxidoreductase [Pseudomonadota bacterium]